MRILALESSGLVASVAILDGDDILAEYTTNFKKTHSETLLPMLSEVMKTLDVDMESIDAIAVSKGPGSFTGLRIGVATAKGLGLASEKPIIEVPTLEGLAYNLFGTSGIIVPIMDARRSEVYTGIYQFVVKSGDDKNSLCRLKVIQDQTAMGILDLIKELNKIGKHVTFLGDGVPVYKDILKEKLSVKYSFAPANVSRQRAGAVAARGKLMYENGEYVKPEEAKPEYLRKSQAEREREEKAKDKKK